MVMEQNTSNLANVKGERRAGELICSSWWGGKTGCLMVMEQKNQSLSLVFKVKKKISRRSKI